MGPSKKKRPFRKKRRNFKTNIPSLQINSSNTENEREKQRKKHSNSAKSNNMFNRIRLKDNAQSVKKHQSKSKKRIKSHKRPPKRHRTQSTETSQYHKISKSKSRTRQRTQSMVKQSNKSKHNRSSNSLNLKLTKKSLKKPKNKKMCSSERNKGKSFKFEEKRNKASKQGKKRRRKPVHSIHSQRPKKLSPIISPTPMAEPLCLVFDDEDHINDYIELDTNHLSPLTASSYYSPSNLSDSDMEIIEYIGSKNIKK